MKNLFRLSLLAALISFNAQASINIVSVELTDSTIIDSSEISALTIRNDNSSLESFETLDGSVIDSSLVKKINFSNKTNSRINSQMAAKVGGEGTGG